MNAEKRVLIALRVLNALRINVPEGGRYSGVMDMLRSAWAGS